MYQKECKTDLFCFHTGVFWFFSVTLWHITFSSFLLLSLDKLFLIFVCLRNDFCKLTDKAFEFPVEYEDRSYLWWLAHLFLLDMNFQLYIFILKTRSRISALLSLGKRHSKMKCQHLCLPVTCIFSKAFDFINSN